MGLNFDYGVMDMFEENRKYKRSDFGWLDEIHRLPNHFNTNQSNKTDMSKATFDIYDIDGEYIDTYSYQQRLMGELMKRWHGNKIDFEIAYIPGFGFLEIPPINVFSLHENGRENNYVVHEFPVNSRVDGKMVRVGSGSLDFHNLQITVQMDDEDLDFRDAVFTADIDRIIPVEVLNAGDLTITNKIVLVKEDLDLAVRELMEDLPVDADTTPHEMIVRGPVDYIDLNRVRMGGYNWANPEPEGKPTIDDNILPWYPVNLSLISKLTGISTTTLSELRHKKKDVNRIMDSTASILTHYASIRYLDAMLASVILNTKVFKVETLDDGSLAARTLYDRRESYKATVISDDLVSEHNSNETVSLFEQDEIPLFSFQVVLSSGVKLDFEYTVIEIGKRDYREVRKRWMNYHKSKLFDKDFIKKYTDDPFYDDPAFVDLRTTLLHVGNIHAIKITRDITREPLRG